MPARQYATLTTDPAPERHRSAQRNTQLKVRISRELKSDLVTAALFEGNTINNVTERALRREVDTILEGLDG